MNIRDFFDSCIRSLESKIPLDPARFAQSVEALQDHIDALEEWSEEAELPSLQEASAEAAQLYQEALNLCVLAVVRREPAVLPRLKVAVQEAVDQVLHTRQSADLVLRLLDTGVT